MFWLDFRKNGSKISVNMLFLSSLLYFWSTDLKGQCHEIFCFRFFHESPSPKPLIITLGSFRIFSKIRGGKWHRWQIATGIVANLPPVTLTPVANNWSNIRLQTPESELESKNLYMFPLLPKGDQIKLLKCFWLKNFSICHQCRWHRWQTLSCEYLREFSKKIETVLMEYSGAGGKLIHEKNQKQKISWHCPLRSTVGPQKFASKKSL